MLLQAQEAPALAAPALQRFVSRDQLAESIESPNAELSSLLTTPRIKNLGWGLQAGLALLRKTLSQGIGIDRCCQHHFLSKLPLKAGSQVFNPGGGMKKDLALKH